MTWIILKTSSHPRCEFYPPVPSVCPVGMHLDLDFWSQISWSCLLKNDWLEVGIERDFDSYDYLTGDYCCLEISCDLRVICTTIQNVTFYSQRKYQVYKPRAASPIIPIIPTTTVSLVSPIITSSTPSTPISSTISIPSSPLTP